MLKFRREARALGRAVFILRCRQRPAIVVVASLEALPIGPGFDPPRGRISTLGLKKTPSFVPRPKHCGVRPNSQGDGPPCTGGAGVRGFSWPAMKRSFYLSKNAVGAVLPPQVKFFYETRYSDLLTDTSVSGHIFNPPVVLD